MDDAPQKRKNNATHYDPQWSFAQLPDLDKRILMIEIANPGITVSSITRMLNPRPDRKRVTAIRKTDIYQGLLYQARRDEFEIIKSLQRTAALVLQDCLNFQDKEDRMGAAHVRLAASKFILKVSIDTTVEKAKMQLAQDMENRRQATPQRHEVVVKYGDTIPVIGETRVDPATGRPAAIALIGNPEPYKSPGQPPASPRPDAPAAAKPVQPPAAPEPPAPDATPPDVIIPGMTYGD